MFYQVGCFFAELSEIDMENLKVVVQNATRRGVQVLASIRVCGYFFLRKCIA